MYIFRQANYAYLRAIWYQTMLRYELPDHAKKLLSKETVRFLEEVGLPTNSKELYDRPHFATFDGQFAVYNYKGKQCCVIGYLPGYLLNLRIPIIIDIKTDNIFVFYGNFDKQETFEYAKIVFVNSSIQQYFASLIAYARIVPALSALLDGYRNNYEQLSFDHDEDVAFSNAIQAEIDILFEHLKTRINEIDSKTFQSDDYWTEATLVEL